MYFLFKIFLYFFYLIDEINALGLQWIMSKILCLLFHHHMSDNDVEKNYYKELILYSDYQIKSLHRKKWSLDDVLTNI